MEGYYIYETLVFEDEEEITYQGVTYGNDYHDALTHILQYFGEKEVESLKLEPLYDDCCLVLTKEVIEDIKKEVY